MLESAALFHSRVSAPKREPESHHGFTRPELRNLNGYYFVISRSSVRSRASALHIPQQLDDPLFRGCQCSPAPYILTPIPEKFLSRGMPS